MTTVFKKGGQILRWLIYAVAYLRYKRLGPLPNFSPGRGWRFEGNIFGSKNPLCLENVGSDHELLNLPIAKFANRKIWQMLHWQLLSFPNAKFGNW